MVAVLIAIACSTLVTAGAFWLFQDRIKDFMPGWKTRILGWLVQALGAALMAVAALDPEMFREILPETKWTGLIIFFIGQLINQVRRVTYKRIDDV